MGLGQGYRLQTLLGLPAYGKLPAKPGEIRVRVVGKYKLEDAHAALQKAGYNAKLGRVSHDENPSFVSVEM